MGNLGLGGRAGHIGLCVCVRLAQRGNVDFEIPSVDLWQCRGPCAVCALRVTRYGSGARGRSRGKRKTKRRDTGRSRGGRAHGSLEAYSPRGHVKRSGKFMYVC